METYPSRIWQRALANQRPARLQSAALMATSALAALLVESGCHEEDDDLDDESAAEAGTTGRCRISIADLDPVFDLVGIVPADFPELRSRIFNKIVADIKAGNFELESGQDVMLRAWAGANTVTGSEAVAEILDEAERMRAEFTRGKRFLGLIHSMRLGRFLIRLGMRRESMR